MKLQHKVLAVIIALLTLTWLMPPDTIISQFVNPVAQAASSSKNSKAVAEAKRENSSDFNSSQKKYDPDASDIIGELVNKRGKFTKQFKKSDGSIEADIYSDAVNYQKPDGTWAEVDDSLEQATDNSGNDILKTKDNGYMGVAFGQKSNSDKLVTISEGKYQVSWNFAGASSLSATNSDSTLTPQVSAILETAIPASDTPASLDATDTATASPEATVSATSAAAQDSSGASLDSGSTVAASVIDDISAEKAKMNQNNQKRLVDKSKSHIEYKDIFKGISFEYYVESERVKEDIIVDQYTPSQSFTFNLMTDGLTASTLDDGTIALSDGKDNIFYIPALVMKDSADQETNDIQMALTPIKGGYQAVITPNDDWMKNAKYPVTIDPVVQTGENINNIHDTYASQKYPNTNYYTYTELRVGYESAYDLLYDYIQFDSTSLPALRPGDVIVGATLNLKNYINASTSYQFNTHRVQASWDSTTLTWNNKPATDSTTSDYQTVTNGNGGEGSWYSWDITDIARQWYTGGNYGVMLNGTCTTDGYRAFYSSDEPTTSYRPSVIIQYMNSAGMTSANTYDSMDAGRAGTASVNDLTGNLVVSQDDIGTTGNRMPVDISHVYNTDMAKNSTYDIGYGVGWQLNYAQLITPVMIGSTQYYRYTDDTGNEQYFYQSGSTYVDESGQSRTFAINTGSTTARYTITDKNDNVWTFDSNGRLDQMSDAIGNNIAIAYSGTTQKITQITDGASRTYTLAYDGTGHLSSITAPGNRVISYGYTTNAYNSVTYYRLTSITYPDSTTSVPMQSTYTYYSTGTSCTYNALNTIKNVDNQELDFTYTSSSTDIVPRVATMAQANGSTLGGSRTFSYQEFETSVTDQLNNENIYQFNQYGNTVSIRDNFGRAVYCQYYDPNATTSSGGSSTYGQNKMSLSSKLQEPVMNYLQNHSLDSTTNWTGYNGAGGTIGTDTTAADVYMGTASFKLYNTLTTGQNQYSQAVNITKGSTYTFSSYVKTDNIQGGTGLGALLVIAYYDGSGNVQYIASDNLLGTNNWTRLSVTLTVPANSTQSYITPILLLQNQGGTAWFDCAQLENQPVVNRYNLVENGDMTYSTSGTPNSWTKNNCDSSDTMQTSSYTDRGLLDSNIFMINGKPGVAKSLSQTIMVSGTTGDTFSFGGWAYANSVPLGTKTPTGSSYNRTFGIKIELKNGSTSVCNITASFNNFAKGLWQYTSGRIIASGTYDRAVISLLYENNCNDSYFDGIQLYKEEFGQCYNYDVNGNVVTAKDLSDQTSSTTYDSNNDPTSLQPPDCTGNDKDTTTYYTGNAKHEVKTTSSVMGVNNSYSYDNYGNTLETDTEDNLTSPTAFVRTTAQYTTNGDYTSQIKNAAGNVTQYNFDSNCGVNLSTTDPSDQTVNYTYDSNNNSIKMGKLTSVSTTLNGVNYSNSYTYSNDMLSTIVQNGFNYTLGYNVFNQPTTVSVAGQNLVTDSYNTSDRSYLMNNITYGNGGKVAYTYDSRHRVSAMTYDNESTPRYTYTYAANDELGSLTDNQNNYTATEYYDLADRLMKTVEKYPNLTRTFQYNYDTDNCLTQFLELFGSTSYKTALAYDKDNRITSVNYNDQPAGSENVRYTYDSLDRLSTRTLKIGSNDYALTYNYLNGGFGADSTTDVVSRINYNNQASLAYNYDNCGRIISVNDGSNATLYKYDALDELIRTDDPTDLSAGSHGSIWVYTFDAGDNITSKILYAPNLDNQGNPVFGNNDLSNNTIIHTYSYTYDTTWKDKLTSYDGNIVATDAIGNTTGYNGWTYSWESGKQLKQMSNGTTTLQFVYNDAGQRTQKINGSTTTKYYWAGYKVDDVSDGTNTLHVWYDAAGAPTMVTFNGINYYYQQNLQGDIIGLMDMTGNTVVSYNYDSWGKQLSCTGSLASTLGIANPLRYRGYIYDNETGLYYLQGRYYNPEWGRFINADDIIGKTGGLNSYNVFAYCVNNPISSADPNGQCFMLITALVGVVVGGIVGGVVAACTGKSILAGAAIGALAGGLIGLTCGAATSLVATGGATLFASTSTVLGSAAATTTAAAATGGGAVAANEIAENEPEIESAGEKALQGAQEAANNFSNVFTGGYKPTCASAVVDETTNNIYYGYSGKFSGQVNDYLANRMSTMTSVEDWDFTNCAEFKAVNNALNDGCNLENLHVATVYVQDTIERAAPVIKAACGNCVRLLNGVKFIE